MISGPLDFKLTGILLKIVQPLAEARIAIFAMSTFDTDYVLIKDVEIKAAIDTLIQSGHLISS